MYLGLFEEKCILGTVIFFSIIKWNTEYLYQLLKYFLNVPNYFKLGIM